MTDIELLPLPEPVAYADPVAFLNFKKLGHLGGPYGREWMWAKPDIGLVAMYSAEQVASRDAEIEARREEVGRLKRIVQKLDNMLGKRPCAGMNADGKPRCLPLAESEARAERLAEALLELCNVIDGHDVPVAVEGKAAHARAALRDHDQEGGAE